MSYMTTPIISNRIESCLISVELSNSVYVSKKIDNYQLLAASFELLNLTRRLQTEVVAFDLD